MISGKLSGKYVVDTCSRRIIFLLMLLARCFIGKRFMAKALGSIDLSRLLLQRVIGYLYKAEVVSFDCST
jgi:hypothetical protein